jgi:hypothetical protein
MVHADREKDGPLFVGFWKNTCPLASQTSPLASLLAFSTSSLHVF